jgi:hypothetical protein
MRKRDGRPFTSVSTNKFQKFIDTPMNGRPSFFRGDQFFFVYVMFGVLTEDIQH